MKKWIQNSLYFLTIAGTAVFIYYQRDKLHLLQNLSAWGVVWLFFLNFVSILLSSYIFKVTLSFFNVNMGFKHWYGISVVNTMYNFILPMKGGLALRGIYLKKNYQLNYAGYVSLVAGNFLIILLVSAIVGCITGFFLYDQGTINARYMLIISVSLLAVLAACVLLFLADSIRLKSSGRIARTVNRILEGVGYFKQRPTGLLSVLVVQALFLMVMGYKLLYIFRVLGMEATFTELLFIQALVIFSRVFAFTPGNIGLKEGVVGLSASILGMDLETALLASVIDRIISVVYIMLNGAFFSKILIEDLSLINPSKKKQVEINGESQNKA